MEDTVDKLVVRRKNGNIYLAKTRLSSEPSDIVDTGVVLKGSSAAQFIIVQMDFNNIKRVFGLTLSSIALTMLAHLPLLMLF